MNPGPRRTYTTAISLEAVAAGWARQEHADGGSVVRITHEVAGRGRGGTVWMPKHGTGVRAAVIARPHLTPEQESLCWPAALTAAANAVSSKTTRTWWPDRLLDSDGNECGAVNVLVILEPGRVDAVVVAARWDLPDVAVDIDLFAAETVRLLDLITTEPTAMLSEHTAESDLFGRRVRAGLLPRGELRGEAAAIGDDGDLMLRTPTGLVQRVMITQLNRLEEI